MQGNTKVWLGIRHVGDSSHSDDYLELTAQEAISVITRFMARNSLKTRMVFVVGRYKEDLEVQFAESRRGKNEIKENDTAFDDFYSKYLTEDMRADIEAEND